MRRVFQLKEQNRKKNNNIYLYIYIVYTKERKKERKRKKIRNKEEKKKEENKTSIKCIDLPYTDSVKHWMEAVYMFLCMFSMYIYITVA